MQEGVVGHMGNSEVLSFQLPGGPSGDDRRPMIC
jgi:hypothetical protein